MKKIKIGLFLSIVFFLVGVLTLPGYGINWDTINHLPRGQAYLNFFLTGKKDFSNLEKWHYYYQKPETVFLSSNILTSEIPRRSLYESDGTTFNWFMEHDGNGHPPLSDIFSALFNQIFFKHLRLINDIDSYRIYSVFLASALVFLIFTWVSKIYGKFAAIISCLSLVLYPLFWSEMHFNNEKDIPETVYWSFMMFALWKGVTEKKLKWIIFSGVCFGLAMGSKFNILFSIFAIVPWAIIWFIANDLRMGKSLKSKFSNILKYLTKLALVPLIGLAIFFASWPYLWPDPLGRIIKVVGFYKGIGLTVNQDPGFLGPFATNTYPATWIIYTTPLIILFFVAIGIIFAILKLKDDRHKTSLLFLLWLAVPIIRVSWPGTTIYGGIRQIMEYIPAMAILAGIGGFYLRNFLFKVFSRPAIPELLITSLLILTFVPISIKLYQIHPNENVYFNPLIGGLKGAKEKDLPSWGNSFGAAYRQGVVWINKNSEIGSKVVLVNELLPNIPNIFFREDINYQNRNRSGFLRQGEYAMTLVYQGVGERSYYDAYLERFIEPVYEVKVDEIAILKVWKNDDAHLKKPLREQILQSVNVSRSQTGLIFDLGEIKSLSRLEIDYNEQNCPQLLSGFVRISQDAKNWETLVGVYPTYWKVAILGPQPQNGQFVEPFVGQQVRYIDLIVAPANSCLTNLKSFRVYIFES